MTCEDEIKGPTGVCLYLMDGELCSLPDEFLCIHSLPFPTPEEVAIIITVGGDA